MMIVEQTFRIIITTVALSTIVLTMYAMYIVHLMNDESRDEELRRKHEDEAVG